MSVPVEIATVPTLPPRDPEGHKGTYGRVLVVAGSRGMSGAAILCGMAALRGGAGLVQVATPTEINPIVAGYNPCYLTAALPQDADGRLAHGTEETILELAAQSDVLALGPGLGQSDAITHIVKTVLQKAELPIVLDADGLNALAKMPLPPHRAEQPPRTHPLILTPHPGEFARLVNLDAATARERREEPATRYAAEHGVMLLLKGHRTLVTDGRRVYRNTTGNPGMATGGTGDVLTGLIAALLAQKLDAFDAAVLGVHRHGLAGDRARNAVGETALIATDLLDYLGFGRGSG